MSEKRSAPRRRVLKTGTLEFVEGAVDCTVRNLSETGAALEVVTPLRIPDRFLLCIPSSDIRRRCHVVRRKQHRIGVAFE
jgi:hypothetical protein